jgi:hypothetical protein
MAVFIEVIMKVIAFCGPLLILLANESEVVG